MLHNVKSSKVDTSMLDSDEFAGDYNSDEFAGKHSSQRSPFMLIQQINNVSTTNHSCCDHNSDEFVGKHVAFNVHAQLKKLLV